MSHIQCPSVRHTYSVTAYVTYTVSQRTSHIQCHSVHHIYSVTSYVTVSQCTPNILCHSVRHTTVSLWHRSVTYAVYVYVTTYVTYIHCHSVNLRHIYNVAAYAYVTHTVSQCTSHIQCHSVRHTYSVTVYVTHTVSQCTSHILCHSVRHTTVSLWHRSVMYAVYVYVTAYVTYIHCHSVNLRHIYNVTAYAYVTQTVSQRRLLGLSPT